MPYVDGCVLPVPLAKLPGYRRLARKAGKIWIEHSALEIRECVADDVQLRKHTWFPQAVKLKADETVVSGDRDRVNAKVMADPRLSFTAAPTLRLRRSMANACSGAASSRW